MRSQRLLHPGEKCLILIDGMPGAEVDDAVGVLSQHSFNSIGLEGLPVPVQPPETVRGVLLFGDRLIVPDLLIVRESNIVQRDLGKPKGGRNKPPKGRLSGADWPNEDHIQCDGWGRSAYASLGGGSLCYRNRT